MGKKFTPIELDKARNLRYGMVALMKIEKKIGKPISKIEFDSLTTEETAIILWAGLVHEDDSLTPEKVAELVDDFSDLTTAAKSMGEALTEAFGKNGQRAAENLENGIGN